MDFFKSVFSDETTSSQPHESDDQTGEEPERNSTETANTTSAWSFGVLIKTLATKSESVIQTYRKDLEELGSGLKKETALIKEVASRAVKDFPASLDTGASVAQESLESVGQVIDDIGSTVWKSTAEIISHGRETLLAAERDSGYSDSKDSIFTEQQLSGNSISQILDAKRYSRFEEKVRALQSDSNTYLEEPELDNYNEWKSGFVLDDKNEDIDRLIKENAVVEEIYGEVVPDRIDHEIFWNRYFYRLHKLKQAEDAREKLVKRAISGDEEEDLSWDFDDDIGENGGYERKGNSSGKGCMTAEVAADHGLVENVITEEKEVSTNDEEKHVPKFVDVAMDKLESVADGTETASDNGYKSEKMSTEGKTDNVASDISIISSQPSMPEEEDLGWDEIEDVGSNDGNKEDASGVASRDDLRKRLSAVDQEEDLSWDTEDDDEPVKSRPGL